MEQMKPLGEFMMDVPALEVKRYRLGFSKLDPNQ